MLFEPRHRIKNVQLDSDVCRLGEKWDRSQAGESGL